MQLFSKSGFWTSRLFIISISIGIQWLFDNHLLDIHWGFDSRGKRSLLEDYRITNRGGKGVKTINITEKTGKLVAIKSVNDDNDIMIIKKSGVTIRIHAKDIKVIGRATQGVNLITLKDGDQIASVCKVIAEEEDVIDNINESNETGIDTEKTES